MSKLENKCRIAKISANIYLYTSATVAAGSRLRILNEVDKNVRQAPLRRNLPLPRPGVDRPLRGNCHPLSSTPDNQVRCVFGSAPYQKQASTVRKGYSVPETPSYGTLRIFKGSQNSRLHRLWTAYCRTGRIFSARNGPRSLCSLRRPLPLLLRRHSVPETAPARM